MCNCLKIPDNVRLHADCIGLVPAGWITTINEHEVLYLLRTCVCTALHMCTPPRLLPVNGCPLPSLSNNANMPTGIKQHVLWTCFLDRIKQPSLLHYASAALPSSDTNVHLRRSA